jgi:hypothetical protein
MARVVYRKKGDLGQTLMPIAANAAASAAQRLSCVLGTLSSLEV